MLLDDDLGHVACSWWLELVTCTPSNVQSQAITPESSSMGQWHLHGFAEGVGSDATTGVGLQ